MTNCAIIVAAGQSARFNSNKMFAILDNKPLIVNTVNKFIEAKIDNIVVVANSRDLTAMQQLFADNANIQIVIGGDTRQQSVECGLAALCKSNCGIVLIHDGARPYIDSTLIDYLIEQATTFGNAIPYVVPTDTTYSRDNDNLTLLCRDNLVNVQTPQAFKYDQITEAYLNNKNTATDDSQIYYNHFNKLNLVVGNRSNIKITYPADLTNHRIGCGSDFHQLVPSRKLILGGVTIPYHLGLDGHSDADVLIHAIMDALLSAINEGDIGTQFPDTDQQYKDISSVLLLQRVAHIVACHKGTILNISAVIIAQNPKLLPYIKQMQSNIAAALNININQISISATTTERLGIIGQDKAMAANCYCLINLQ